MVLQTAFTVARGVWCWETERGRVTNPCTAALLVWPGGAVLLPGLPFVWGGVEREPGIQEAESACSWQIILRGGGEPFLASSLIPANGTGHRPDIPWVAAVLCQERARDPARMAP